MEKLKFLIVEDESLIALYLKTKLSNSGYNVCLPVASGEKAIESVKKNNPDVILMDIRLSGEMDGLECARQIGSFSSALIIFTSGYQDSSLMERLKEFKQAAFLNKPVEVSDIEETIYSINKT